MAKRLTLLSILLLLVLGSACSNILAGFSDRNTDEALYEDALLATSSSDFDTAIGKFQQLSPDFLARTEVREAYAGALAGKCGLNFLSYVSGLGSAPDAPFFKWLMNAFSQKVVNPEYCAAAQQQIRFITSDANYRSSNQNLFLLINSMAKVGTYLRARADTDSTGNLGDGTADSNFNVCNSTPADSSEAILTDDEIKQIITGFALILENASAFASVLGGASSTIDSLSDACGPPLNLTICSKTEVTAVTAAEVTAMRNLLATGAANPTVAVGVGSCTSAAVIDCCP